MQPQEIIDMFIDNLAVGGEFSNDYSKPALAACALVCRSWVPRSRYHLFSHVVLDSDIAAFAPLLRSDKCTFLPSVRGISAFRTFMDPNDHHFDKIGKDLKRLTNVRTLMLDGMFHACAPWADFMCGFKNVTELSVHFHLAGNSNCVLGMIHMLPSLEQLSVRPLSPVIFWTGSPPPPSIDISPRDLTPPPPLHNLKTGGESARHLLAWLKWYNCLGKIDTLDLSPVPAADESQMNELLSRMGSTLRHLKLGSESLFMGNGYRYASLLDIVDLSVYKKLKTLEIPKLNSDTQDAAAYEWLLKFILRISAPSLEHVVLDYPGAGYTLMPWTVVDTFFASPDFPRLRTVRISTPEQFNDYFKENLPRLHELGLLKIARNW
ncbi:hypothetical protein C8R44DRAFT_892702 [Mycena epipterygia]|nr:hypothetical protein C8R44DRAFT_892702 [Mycena epipterygia]